jgi:uncharacterized membrane protein YedE/YeeE
LTEFTPVSSTLGGVMIGLAVAGLYHLTGKVLGISNITAELISAKNPGKAWRATFIAGLLAGGVLLLNIYPQALSTASPRATLTLIVAGLLVGYGSALGRGCTSGHGICGITRLSGRSIVATLVFMGTGMLTVFIANHLGGL